MFTVKPISLEGFRPEDVNVIVAAYTRSDSAETDKANALAALAKKLLVLDVAWAADNGGIFESLATTGITSVARGDGTSKHPTGTGYTELTTDVVITLARVWESAATGERNIHVPIVLYNDQIVPVEDLSHLGDGFTATDRVIIVNNTGLKYGPAVPVGANWKVSLFDPLWGCTGSELGGVELPVTTTKHKVLGIAGAVIERTTKDGKEHTGSLTVLELKGRVKVANGQGGVNPEVLNNPGEDWEKAVYGAAWTKGASNTPNYLPDTQRVVVCLVKWNPEFPLLAEGSAAADGQVFCKLHIHFGGEITGIQTLQGTEAESTDPVQRQVQFKFSDYAEHVILTA